MTCGAESWTETIKMGSNEKLKKNGNAEKMYGPAHEDGYWRIKVNKGTCNKFKYPDIVTIVKQHIMEYRGHIV